jgi:hypothetical protein
MRPRRLAALALAASTLAGCGGAMSITERVHIFGGTLSPPAPHQLLEVRTSANDALATVLQHENDTGWPDIETDFEDGGCVLVAWLEPAPVSHNPDPGPPYPVFLVRLGDAATRTKVTWVMVDARTGRLGSALTGPSIGGCVGASGDAPG